MFVPVRRFGSCVSLVSVPVSGRQQQPNRQEQAEEKGRYICGLTKKKKKKKNEGGKQNKEEKEQISGEENNTENRRAIIPYRGLWL